MNDKKPFWQSKALWGALLIGLSVSLTYLGYPEFGDVMIGLGMALGITGLRLAKTSLR